MNYLDNKNIELFNSYGLTILISIYICCGYGLKFMDFKLIGIHNIIILLLYVVNLYFIIKYYYKDIIIRVSSILLAVLSFKIMYLNSYSVDNAALVVSLFLFQLIYIMKQISIDKLLTVIYSLLLINSLLTISQFFIRYLFLENINLDFIYPSLYFIHEAMPFYGVGFTTHPSTNAFFLIFAIGLSLYKIINSEKKVDYIILSIGFLALYCTLSRTAIFITMLSLLLLFFINKKVFIKALSIEIILYGAFIFIPFDSNYGDKISILTYLGTHNKEYSLQDTSKISRTLNIKNDLNMFQKLDFYEKIFGLKLSYYEHKSTYVKHELMPENEKSYLLEQQSPHFLPFYMIFKYGLILFILIGIFILFVTLYVFKNKNFTSLYFLYLSYCLMLYSYTHDLFDNRLYWLVLGLCAVYSKRHNE